MDGARRGTSRAPPPRVREALVACPPSLDNPPGTVIRVGYLPRRRVIHTAHSATTTNHIERPVLRSLRHEDPPDPVSGRRATRVHARRARANSTGASVACWGRDPAPSRNRMHRIEGPPLPLQVRDTDRPCPARKPTSTVGQGGGEWAAGVVGQRAGGEGLAPTDTPACRLYPSATAHSGGRGWSLPVANPSDASQVSACRAIRSMRTSTSEVVGGGTGRQRTVPSSSRQNVPSTMRM